MNREKSILKEDYSKNSKRVYNKRKEFLLINLTPNKYRFIDEDITNVYPSEIILQCHIQRASAKTPMNLAVYEQQL